MVKIDPAESLPQATSRLRFGRWGENDLDLASALWRDPDVMRYLGGPYSEAQVRERLDREIATQAREGIQYWPVFLLEDGQHVGCCGLKPAPEQQRREEVPPVFELGFHLRREYWGAGLAAEAAAAAVAFAVERLGANALFAGHHPQNAASKALLERLAFKQIGTHFYEPTGLDHPWYRRKSEE